MGCAPSKDAAATGAAGPTRNAAEREADLFGVEEAAAKPSSPARVPGSPACDPASPARDAASADAAAAALELHGEIADEIEVQIAATQRALAVWGVAPAEPPAAPAADDEPPTSPAGIYHEALSLIHI